MTHREFKLWLQWIDKQWNVPNRTDNYLMQIAAEIRRGNSKKGATIKLPQFLLKFTSMFTKKVSTSPQEDPKEVAKRAKAAWISGLGSKVRIVKQDKPS